MMSIWYLSSLITTIVSVLCGIVLLGFGIWIWVRGHVRIGGLLGVAGVVHAGLGILSPLLHLFVSPSMGYAFAGGIGVLLSALRLLFWLPLFGALFFTVQGLAEPDKVEDLDATLA